MTAEANARAPAPPEQLGRRPAVAEIEVAADPVRWSRAGFAVDGDGTCRVGRVQLRLAGPAAGRGLVRWSVARLRPEAGERKSIDGIPTMAAPALAVEPARHPNGVIRLDHVVAFSPDLDRTIAALEDAGLDLRRRRDGPTPGGATRQAFFRVGEPILEVIEQPAPDGRPVDRHKPARLWGLAFLVGDLDATAERLGDLLGTPRDAVQPGRRIATAKRSAALGAAVAFITPAPAAAAGASGSME